MLATRDDVGHALTADEETGLLSECLNSRSRCLYPAVMIALNTECDIARFGCCNGAS
jgi:hypothetical protein